MSNSRALVIKSIKQGETSSIVSCYLEDIGFKSFLVKGLYSKKRSKFSKAHFFPLNVISLNYSYIKNRNLGYIKEVKSEIIFKSIYTDIQKSSVIVFLSEILNSVFREELQENKDLFDFLLNSLLWYDKTKNCNIFHIKFLIELTKFIGFFPNVKNKNDNYFSLESGSTTNTEPINESIKGEDLKLFNNLLGMKFEDLNKMSVGKESRTRILNKIIDYYSLHLQTFKTPRSINVFTEIFK